MNNTAVTKISMKNISCEEVICFRQFGQVWVCCCARMKQAWQNLAEHDPQCDGCIRVS